MWIGAWLGSRVPHPGAGAGRSLVFGGLRMWGLVQPWGVDRAFMNCEKEIAVLYI